MNNPLYLTLKITIVLCIQWPVTWLSLKLGLTVLCTPHKNWVNFLSWNDFPNRERLPKEIVILQFSRGHIKIYGYCSVVHSLTVLYQMFCGCLASRCDCSFEGSYLLKAQKFEDWRCYGSIPGGPLFPSLLVRRSRTQWSLLYFRDPSPWY